MTVALLGVGANLGYREETIKRAIVELNANPHVQVQKVSKLIETKAVSRFEQPDFLNGACQIETTLDPLQLLTFTQDIEKNLGRTAKGHGDPRTIDIDILFYGKEVLSFEHLIVPHLLLHERPFVLAPLFEIAPQFMHPVLQEPISSIYYRVVGY